MEYFKLVLIKWMVRRWLLGKRYLQDQVSASIIDNGRHAYNFHRLYLWVSGSSAVIFLNLVVQFTEFYRLINQGRIGIIHIWEANTLVGHFGQLSAACANTLSTDGLRGPIIVHDPAAPYASEIDEEIVLTLSDWYHDQALPLIR